MTPTITAELEKLREALAYIMKSCLCCRDTKGFDYRQEHRKLGKPPAGQRWVEPKERALLALTTLDAVIARQAAAERALQVAVEALTWLCVREVHYDVDVRTAPNLTQDAWEKADAALALIKELLKGQTSPEQPSSGEAAAHD